MTPSLVPLPAAAPATVPPPQGWPWLRLGFRLFYLGAALYGALAIPLWIALLLGAVSLPLTVAPVLWHAHEMLFGFAGAVIVGILLTAGKAWTGLDTPGGWPDLRGHRGVHTLQASTAHRVEARRAHAVRSGLPMFDSARTQKVVFTTILVLPAVLDPEARLTQLSRGSS